MKELKDTNDISVVRDLNFILEESGLKTISEPEFVAEGGDSYFDWVKIPFQNSVSFVDNIKSYVNRIWNSLANFCDGVVDSMKKLLLTARDKLIQIIIDYMLPKGVSVEYKSLDWTSFSKTLLVIVGSLLLALGIITTAAFSFLWKGFEEVKQYYVCEGPLNVVGLVSALAISGVGTFSNECKENMTKKLMYLSKVLTHASVVGAGSYMIFMLLPTAIRTSLVYRFGTQEQIKAMEADDWLVMASSLNRCAADPRLLAHPRMLEEVEKSIRSGRDLVKYMQKDKRPMMYKTFHDLVRVSRNLYAYHEVGTVRPTPYGLHIAGASGAGKSTIVQNIIEDMMEKEHPTVFSRSNVEEFWSGFIDQEVVLMDEFLVGTNDLIAGRAQEYLALVSNQLFVPRMASLDMPTVGIKGTQPKPNLVVTMNNTTHNRPVGVDQIAFQRRRNVVLELLPKPQYLTADGRVDFSLMTSDEIRYGAWLEFRIHPGVWNPQVQGHNVNLTYREVIDYLKEDYRQFHATGERIRGAQGTAIKEIDPAEIIAEITRKDFDIEPFCFSSFMKFIPDMLPTLVAQGSRSRRTRRRRKNDTQAESQDIVLEGEGSRSDLNAIVTLPDELSCAQKQSHARTVIETGKLCLHQASVLAHMFVPTGMDIGSFVRSVGRVFFIANGIYGICRIVSSMISGKGELFINEAKYGKKTRKENKSRNDMVRGLKHAQGSSDYVKIKLDTCTNTTSIHGMAIGGRYVMTYYHTIGQFFKENDYNDVKCNVTFGQNYYEFELAANSLIHCANNDFVAFQVNDPNYPILKSRANKFITDHEAYNTEIFEVAFGLHECKFAPARIERGITYNSIGFGNHCLDYAVTYRLLTSAGDCGKIVKAVDSIVNGKIIGMHVAGSVEKGPNSVGVCNIITKEMINEVLGKTQDFQIGELASEGILNKTILDKPLVHLPSRTKLKPSKIANYLGWEPERFPAVLTDSDPRNVSGTPPILKHIEVMEAVVHPEVDKHKVDIVFATMLKNYKRDLDFEGGYRDLTIEEAVGGIPGVIQGLDLNTSVGWPLLSFVNKPGKKTWVTRNEDGTVEIEDFLRKMVMKRIDDFEAGVIREHISLGYLKDELVSLEKIETGRTRVIYAPDLVNTIVMRMKYGMLFHAMASTTKTSMAIGINPQSYDINNLYLYLYRKDGYFIAGDYKGFDCHIVPEFRDGAINLMNALVDGYVSMNMQNSMKHLMVNLTMVLGNIKFRPSSMNASGSVFTTYLNCIINEAYMRYAFMSVCPNLRFDEHVRMKCLGDDHVVCTTKDTGFDGKAIQREMAKLGQTYTSDDKSKSIVEWRNFDEITFLGSHPKKYMGKWTGALRERSMRDALYWTRDGDATLMERVNQVLDYASQWEKGVYLYYEKICERALKAVGLELERPCYEEARFVVANRGTYQHQFQAEGDEGNLTTFSAVGSKGVSEKSEDQHITKAMSQTHGSLDFSTDSSVYRTTFTWQTSHNKGAIIGTLTAPYGILNIGEKRNLQNMPFERYIYWRGDVELTVQINGNPFQQGYLVLYWYPLSNKASTLDIHSWTSCQHIVLTPRGNTTATIRVPYRFPRGALNTYALAEDDENLGQFALGVMSPLVQSGDVTAVEVTVYSSFPDSRFYLPRPLTAEGPRFIAEGQGISRATYNYNISRVAGDVPIETTTAKMENAAQVDLPMDNPPLSSGAVPMVPAFSGMSKAIGLEPTTSFALHPSEMTRTHHDCFDPKETKVEYVLGLPGYLTSFNWSVNDGPNTILEGRDLNSTVGIGKEVSASLPCPPNVAFLNFFSFWRADIEIELVAVKTSFHSGRLRVSIGFGAPDVVTADLHVFYNQVLDFGPDVDRHTVLIPYNQVTEYLRTFDMEAVDPVQDYSLGHMAISVANALRAPNTVADTIEVLMFVRFVNARVAVPRPLPCVAIKYLTQNGAIKAWEPQTMEFDLIAEGPIKDAGDVSDDAVHDTEPTEITEVKELPKVPLCRLMVGQKFEYVVQDVNELARRHHVIHGMLNLKAEFERVFVDYKVATSDGTATRISPVLNLPVTPMDLMRTFYAAWGGTLKYRVYRTSDKLNPVAYYPINSKGIDGTWRGFNSHMYDNCAGSAVYDPGHLKYHVVRSTDGLSTYGPREMAMPLPGNNFVDVSVPFFTQFNFCLTSSAEGPTDVGYIACSMVETATDVPKCQIFQAAGDDFSYGVFRPPLESTINTFKRHGLVNGKYYMAGHRWIVDV
jgi:hypothetical protein